MALDPSARYPAQIDTTTDPTGYPHGAAKNILATGDGTGTPWEKDLVNDIFGMQQALLDKAGATPSGDADKVGASQYVDAIDTIIDQEFVKSRTLMVPLLYGQPSDANWNRPAGATGGAWTSPVAPNQSYVIFSLNDILPNGCTITAITASVNPDIARSTGSRMEVTAFVEAFNMGTDGGVASGTVLGTQEGDNTSSQKLIVLSGLTHVVDLTLQHITAAVRCGSGGGGSDFIRALTVTFSQVSPRKAA